MRLHERGDHLWSKAVTNDLVGPAGPLQPWHNRVGVISLGKRSDAIDGAQQRGEALCETLNHVCL